MTTCSRADAGAGSNYPFLTQKERDNETGLDYFGARYCSSTQGRFTSSDPYNIVFETEITAERNPQKAERNFLRYLGQPQNWNRYAYVSNNPLKYTDPTGEVIYLRGTAEEQQAALARQRSMFGEERWKFVKVSAFCDAKLGDVTVLSYDSKASHMGMERVGKTELDIGFSVHMADILESKKIIEYRLS